MGIAADTKKEVMTLYQQQLRRCRALLETNCQSIRPVSYRPIVGLVLDRRWRVSLTGGREYGAWKYYEMLCRLTLIVASAITQSGRDNDS